MIRDNTCKKPDTCASTSTTPNTRTTCTACTDPCTNTCTDTNSPMHKTRTKPDTYKRHTRTSNSIAYVLGINPRHCTTYQEVLLV